MSPEMFTSTSHESVIFRPCMSQSRKTAPRKSSWVNRSSAIDPRFALAGLVPAHRAPTSEATREATNSTITSTSSQALDLPDEVRSVIA